MNELWAHMAGFATTLAIGSPLVLCIGLALAGLLARNAARAHATLVLAAILALTVPLLTRVGRTAGLGVLPPPTATSVAADPLHDPVQAENSDAKSLVAGPIATDAGPGANDTHAQIAMRESAPLAATTSQSWFSAVISRAGEFATPLAIWIALSILVLARLAVSLARGLGIVARAVPIEDQAVRQWLNRAARRLRLDSLPQAFESRDVLSPIIWCWGLRPMLLVPPLSFSHDGSAAKARIDWESVFCHELAHWKRRDHLSALLAELLCCAVPWNPLAWMVRKRVAFLADRACDEHVLAAGCDGPNYADSLLRFVPAADPAFALGAVSSRKGLARRIEAILARRVVRPDAGRAWLASVAGVAACVGLTALLLQPAPAKAQPDASPREQASPAEDIEAIAARLAALSAENWREAFAVGEQLASLAGDEGFEILAANWTTIPSQARQQMLKAWRFATPFPLHDRMHPRLLDTLHLGMTDAAPDVQNWSIGYLRSIAFRDFAPNYSAYTEWYRQNRARPLLDVMREECRRYVTELSVASGPQLEELAKLDFGWVFRDVPQLAAIARDAGLLDTFGRWMSDPALAGNAAMRCMDRVLPYAGADERFLRDVVLNAAQNGPNAEIRSTAIRTLGKQELAWAVEPLRQLLIDAYRTGGDEMRSTLWAVAQALGEMNDPSVIPTMISIIADDNTYDTVYGIGYFGLGKLTGVNYDEAHNGAWWKNWWSKNSLRYPAAVAATALPAITRPGAARTAAAKQDGGGDDDDLKDVPSEDIRIGKDENRRYFLIGFDKKKAAPKDGYKLLVVLPGGDGSADFNPFIKRVWKNALPEGYLIAQAVAPKWRDDENRIVWPTRQLPDEKMKFTTEEFVVQIVKDVQNRAKIDKRNVTALGWSSGGPPVYNVALLKDSPLSGAFVAMSVYKPENLPDRSAAKGRAFYLQHSPQDFIKMTFPEAAEKDLTAAGASVKLQTYEGGHGWRGDVFGNIRTGVEWLAAQTAPEKK